MWGQVGRVHTVKGRGHDEEQDGHLGRDNPFLGATHDGGPGDVEDGDHDDDAAEEEMIDHGRRGPWEETVRISGKGSGVQGDHHDVAEPQQDIESTNEDTRPERLVEKGDGSAAARVGDRKPGIGGRGEEGHASGDEKRDRSCTAGQLNGQSENSEDAATDHSADPDRDRAC